MSDAPSSQAAASVSPPTAELHEPQLREVAEQLRAVIARAERLVAGLEPAELLARPSPEAWSVAECLEHLNISDRAGLTSVAEALEQARTRGLTGSGPYRARWFMRLFARLLEPPVRRRITTGRNFVPKPHLDPDEVVRSFFEIHAAQLEQLAQLEGVALDRLRIVSPFARWLRYTPYEWLLVMLAHDRRHLWQAEQAAAALTAGEASSSSAASGESGGR